MIGKVFPMVGKLGGGQIGAGSGLVFGGDAEDFFEGGDAREDLSPAVHAEGVHAVGDGVFLDFADVVGVVACIGN